MTPRTATVVGCLVVLSLLIGTGLVFFLLFGLVDRDTVPGIGEEVAVIRLTGPIVSSDRVVRDLEEAGKDKSVKAVVFRIDSPGGGIAPSQEIHDAIIRLRTKKPVVASMGGTAASGGYYVAVACDSIVANPGTLTGSIGVIFSWITAEELLRKAGVRMQVFKSGAVKDVGSFAREPTDEEKALISGVVNDGYEQFLEAVLAGRRITRERLRPLADGRVFTGRQALPLGLVDRLGGERDAVLLAARLGGITGEPTVVDWRRVRFHVLDWIDETSSTWLPETQGPRLEYRLR